MSFHSISIFAQCLLLSLALIRGVRSDCYYPDGQNATDYDYVPCEGGSGFSSCCNPGEGDVCLSNGLCYYNSASSPYPYRGTCTDPTFKDTACAQYCVLNNPDTYQTLTSCGGTQWCCSDTSDCCSKPNLVFDIGVPSVINAYSSTASFATLSLLPTTGQKTVITAAATGSASGALITSGAASATSTGTSSAASSSSTAATSVPKTVVIGIAAGLVVVLFLAIAGGVALCCLLRARKRRQQQSAASAPVTLMDMHSAPHNPQVNDTSSTANLVHKPMPEKQGWTEPAPAYTPPHRQTQGQNVFELQSPIVRPNQPGGPVYHEMHG